MEVIVGDKTEKVVSIHEWYYEYHNELKDKKSTKRENKVATKGLFKCWIIGSLFCDALIFGTMLLYPIINFLLQNTDKIQVDTYLYLYIHVPIVILLALTFMLVCGIKFRPKITKMMTSEEKYNELAEILFSGLDGWYHIFVYTGVGKKERKRIEKKFLEKSKE